MNMQRCAVLTLVLSAALALPTRPAQAASDDLLSVYAQARGNDPQRASAQAQRGVAQEVAAQARAALLPQWQLSASETRPLQDGGRSPASTSQFVSSVSQTLFDANRSRQRDAANTAAEAEDARLRLAEQELCARVARAYFGVLAAQANLATTLANEEAFALQVAQAQSRLAAGLSAQVDLDQARTYHALAQGNTMQARQTLADSREALVQVAGRAAATLKPLRVDLPAASAEQLGESAWLEKTLNQQPQLQAQALSLRASEERIGAARAGHWPTVSVALDSTRNNAGSANNSASSHTLALKLNLPLFAGGATESGVRQAAFLRDGQRADLEALRRSLQRETQAQLQAVITSQAQIDSGRAAVAAATRALASTRAGQALGTRTMTDLILAIQTHTAAQNALDQARHSYALASVLLQRAAGTLDEQVLAHINTWLQGD
jgi:outer membrane protein